MTGFGSGESRRDGIRAIVEIRSVNARFFEARLRLPAEALPLEVEVRRKVSEVVRRGKVDLTASFEAEALPGVRLRVNRGLAAEYLHAAEQLRQEFHLDGAVGLPQLLAVPGLMEIERSESAMDPGFATILMEALEAALQSHDGARRVEGNQLGADLDRHLEEVDRLRSEIAERAGSAVVAAKKKLEERLRKLVSDAPLDPGRLEQEVAFLADRSDITEELVRLGAHLDSGRALLRDESEPAGKKLEFLLQELGRETNTLGSKGADLEISRRVLAMKAALEKMREQAQNVE
jgi:uncharacterized protein (TIGR00255 family)